jgi:hypothetical protein
MPSRHPAILNKLPHLPVPATLPIPGIGHDHLSLPRGCRSRSQAGASGHFSITQLAYLPAPRTRKDQR